MTETRLFLIIFFIFILFLLFQIYYYNKKYYENNLKIDEIESFRNTINEKYDYVLDDKSLEVLLKDYNKIKNSI